MRFSRSQATHRARPSLSSSAPTSHRSPARRHILAATLSLALPAGAALVSPTSGLPGANLLTPFAFAGPDDQKTVLEKGHIDAPKVYWDEEKRNFLVQANDSHQSVEKHVTWLQPSYRSGPQNGQSYLYVIEDSEDKPYLGEDGTPLYLAHGAPPSQTEMLWQGLGADKNFPVDTFRDGDFMLEMVDFSGPGEMNIQQNIAGDFGPTVRMFSSHSLGHRSFLMWRGTHTHPDTTFSKPGRYVTTLRGTARGTDGKLIASNPETFVYQVGGTRPNPNGIGDVHKAYETASVQGKLTSPELSLAPATNQKHDDAQYLSTLHFTTGGPQDEGTAVFYIDGHFLAEVPVKEGKAEWTEMLGDGASDYQVVYIPKSDSSTPRWVSAAVNYDRSDEKKSTTEAGDFPTPKHRTPAPKFDTSEFTPSSDEVTLTLTQEPGSESTGQLTVTPTDPTVTLHVLGGVYAKSSLSKEREPNAGACSFSFTSTPQQRTQNVDLENCDGAGFELDLKVTPGPRSTVGGFTLKQDVSPEQLRSLNLKASLGAGSNAVAEVENASPAAITEAGPENGGLPQPEATQQVELRTEQTTIRKGHIDIGPYSTSSGVRIGVGDGSAVKNNGSTVYRDPSAVTFEVSSSAKHAFESKKRGFGGDQSFRQFGKIGEEVYFLGADQSTEESHPWVGFSSPRVNGENHYDFEVETEKNPDGAQWWAFNQTLGKVSGIFFDGTSRRTMKNVGHSHVNWLFTKPGEYKLKVRAIPPSTPGSESETKPTEWATITFNVAPNDVGKPSSEDNQNDGGASQPGGLSDWVKALLGVLGVLGGLGILGALGYFFLNK